MRVRRRGLQEGWYPRSARRVESRLLELQIGGVRRDGAAGVVPHAGWDFSGAVAAAVVARLVAHAQTVAVVGGHLRVGDPVLAAFEDAFETPQGIVEADLALLEAVRGRLNLVEDRFADNSVEVQLPLVRHFLPTAKLLAFRAPPDGSALELGRALFDCARELDRDLAVIGSTDLTHYGPSYGFMPRGGGEEALRWVREVNDRRFIDAALACDPGRAISLAVREHSACSAGGAASAMAFACEAGALRGELVSYLTSYDVMPGSSFVGYAGIVYGSGEYREQRA